MPRGRPRKHPPPAHPRRPKRAKWGEAVDLLLSWKLAETGGDLRGRNNADENRRAFLAYAARRGVSLDIPDVLAWKSLRKAFYA